MTYSERLTPLPAMDLWSRLIDGVTWNEDELEVPFVTGNIIQSQQYPILGTRYTGPTEYRIARVVLGVSYTLPRPFSPIQDRLRTCSVRWRLMSTATAPYCGPISPDLSTFTARDSRMLLRVMSGIRDVSVNRAIRPPTLGI